MKKIFCLLFVGMMLLGLVGCVDDLPKYEFPVIESSQTQPTVTSQEPIIIVTLETETELIDPNAPTAPFDRIYNVPTLEEFQERFVGFIEGEWEAVSAGDGFTEITVKTQNGGVLKITAFNNSPNNYEYKYQNIDDIDVATNKILEVISYYLCRDITDAELDETKEAVRLALAVDSGYEVSIFCESQINVYVYRSENSVCVSFV